MFSPFNPANFHAADIWAEGEEIICTGEYEGALAVVKLTEAGEIPEDIEYYRSKRHTLVHHNDIYYTGEVDLAKEYDVEFICPVGAQDVPRMLSGYEFVNETPGANAEQKHGPCNP